MHLWLLDYGYKRVQKGKKWDKKESNYKNVGINIDFINKVLGDKIEKR